jgi:hypothetical protein
MIQAPSDISLRRLLFKNKQVPVPMQTHKKLTGKQNPNNSPEHPNTIPA